MTSAEWGGLATAVFAGLGLFATDRQKDFWRTTLALDLLALISSAVPAAVRSPQTRASDEFNKTDEHA